MTILARATARSDWENATCLRRATTANTGLPISKLQPPGLSVGSCWRQFSCDTLRNDGFGLQIDGYTKEMIG